MRKISLYTLALIFVGSMFACNKDLDNNKTGSGNEADRKALLENVANNIIVPAYKSFQMALTEMNTAVSEFIQSPDMARLSVARSKWKQAYIAWQKVELFDFGPAANNRNFFNIYPCDALLLESFVRSGSYNLDALSNNKVQGFPALDYLLNHSDESTVLAEFTTDAAASGRKKYTTDILAMMKSKTDAVVSTWETTYLNTFIADAGTGAGSPLSLMTNEYIMYFERFLRSGKYGIPAGVMTGTAIPENVEAYYSHTIGNELAQAAIQAMYGMYKGQSFDKTKEGVSYYSYLKALASGSENAAAVADDINDQFGVITTKTNLLGNSIYQAILSDRRSVLDAYDAFQTQVRYLKVDMTSAIGISITYTDNDGD